MIQESHSPRLYITNLGTLLLVAIVHSQYTHISVIYSAKYIKVSTWHRHSMYCNGSSDGYYSGRCSFINRFTYTRGEDK